MRNDRLDKSTEAEIMLLRLALALAVREVNSAISTFAGELHDDEKWTPDCFRQMAEDYNPENDADPDALPEVDAGAICDSELCNTEWPLDMCGYQCDCGSYIWAKGDSEHRRDPDELPDVDASDLESHAPRGTRIVHMIHRTTVAGVAAEVEDCGNGHYELVLRADPGEDLYHFVGGDAESGTVHATFSLSEVLRLGALFGSFPAISSASPEPSLHPAPPHSRKGGSQGGRGR